MRFFRSRDLLLIILLLPIKAIAQPVFSISDSTKLQFIGLTASAGSIVTASQRVRSLSFTHPVMLQFDFSFIKNTQQSWNYCNCYNKTGLSVSYTDFNNPKNLGQAINLAVFTEPIIYYSPKFQLLIRGGAGLSYLNKVFDVQSNPENLFYSSPLSFILMLRATASYQVNQRISINLAGQFNHISNGGTRYPNWGINFPMLSLGAGYQLNQQKLIPRIHLKLTSHRLKLIMHAYGGRHLEDGSKRIVTGINTGLIKPLSLVNGIGLGGEVTYDLIYKVLEERRNVHYNSLLASLSVQHYFFLGKLLFGQQLAYYLVPPNPNSAKKIYQLYTLEYHLSNQWYGGVTLKAHGGISDYLTLSIGKVIELK